MGRVLVRETDGGPERWRRSGRIENEERVEGGVTGEEDLRQETGGQGPTARGPTRPTEAVEGVWEGRTRRKESCWGQGDVEVTDIYIDSGRDPTHPEPPSPVVPVKVPGDYGPCTVSCSQSKDQELLL